MMPEVPVERLRYPWPVTWLPDAILEVVPPERDRMPPPVTVEPAARVSSMFFDRVTREFIVSIDVMVVPVANTGPNSVSPMESLSALAGL